MMMALCKMWILSNGKCESCQMEILSFSPTLKKTLNLESEWQSSFHAWAFHVGRGSRPRCSVGITRYLLKCLGVIASPQAEQTTAEHLRCLVQSCCCGWPLLIQNPTHVQWWHQCCFREHTWSWRKIPHPSIHPSISVLWQKAKRGIPGVPLPSNIFQLLLAQLAPFHSEEQCFFSRLSLDQWAPYPGPKGEPSHTRRLILATCIHDLVRSIITQSSWP